MSEAELVAIHLTPARGGDPAPAEAAEVVAGAGLVGDRYGDTAHPKHRERGQVTLIEAEALEAVARDYQIELSAAECRRNLLTRGVPLNHLVGRRFHVGEVELEGSELCEPCGYLERTTGKAVKAPLRHRGGLRARVLAGGTLRVGDPVRW